MKVFIIPTLTKAFKIKEANKIHFRFMNDVYCPTRMLLPKQCFIFSRSFCKQSTSPKLLGLKLA